MPETNSNSLHRELATVIVAFQEAVARRLGMTAAERKCAGLIAELRQSTPKQLAEMTGLTTGAITGIVDRLERAGYAKREPNPKDRRSVIVRARNIGKLNRVTSPLFQSLTAAMTELDARYTLEERALIQRHLQDTIAILRQEIAEVEKRG
jgi:DNA-binding MarR family transcriptional regulator